MHLSEYVNAGLSSLPADLQTKCPIGKWKRYQYAPPTPQQIAFWGDQQVVCIVCGAVSGNLEVLDFDHQARWYPAWAKQIPSELLDRLVIEQSQSGGRHIVYRCEEPVDGNLRLALDGTDIMIETRGEGGQFLCAPSPGYTLIQGELTKLPVITVEERHLMIEVARSLSNPAPSLKHTLNRSAATRYPVVLGEGGRPGDDYNQRGDVRALLEQHGWRFIRVDGENERWLRPGKSHGESASLRISDRIFYNFSSGAPEIPPGNGYSPFAVYAMLEHNGDFNAASKALRETGFGDDEEPYSHVDLSCLIAGITTEAVAEPVVVEVNEDITDDAEEEEDEDMQDGGFPPHLLQVPGFVGELADHINKVSFKLQPVPALAAALAAQGYLAGRKVEDPLRNRTNLYILVAGATCTGKERGREIVKSILDSIGEHHYIEDVASYQGLIRALASRGVLLWLWDELGKKLPELTRPNGQPHLTGVVGVLLRLFTSADKMFMPDARASVNDQSPPINNPHLVLYGTSTPQQMYEGFSVDAIESGLIGRLLIFEADDHPPRQDLESIPDIPADLIARARWWNNYRPGSAGNNALLVPEVAKVPHTPVAHEIFKELRSHEWEADQSGDAIRRALWGRAEQQARQLGLIYACSANHENPVIDEAAARWAVDLMVYLVSRKIQIARRWIADDEFDRRQLAVVRYVEQRNSVSRSVLTRHFKRWKPRERQEIIDNLIETRQLIIETEDTGGRPKDVFRVKNKRSK